MIANEKQYQITKKYLQEFKKNLEVLTEKKDEILHSIHVNSIKAKIEDFEKEINEYELLKNGEINYINIQFSNFPDALIKGRIAKGWSQGDLANHLNMKEQQIQRYEACHYSTASLPRLMEIADIIGLSFSNMKVRINDTSIVVAGIDHATLAAAQNRLKENKSLIIQ